jgi:hypothetical protein
MVLHDDECRESGTTDAHHSLKISNAYNCLQWHSPNRSCSSIQIRWKMSSSVQGESLFPFADQEVEQPSQFIMQ